MQSQCRAFDQSLREQRACHVRPRFQCFLDLMVRQIADFTCDKARAEIAVGLQLMGRTTLDGGMSGQIDGVGDDRGGGVGLRRCSRENSNRVGDTERKTAPMPPTGSDAARGIVDAGLVDRPLTASDPSGLTFTPLAASATQGFVTRGALRPQLARVLRWIAASAVP